MKECWEQIENIVPPTGLEPATSAKRVDALTI